MKDYISFVHWLSAILQNNLSIKDIESRCSLKQLVSSHLPFLTDVTKEKQMFSIKFQLNAAFTLIKASDNIQMHNVAMMMLKCISESRLDLLAQQCVGVNTIWNKDNKRMAMLYEIVSGICDNIDKVCTGKEIGWWKDYMSAMNKLMAK